MIARDNVFQLDKMPLFAVLKSDELNFLKKAARTLRYKRNAEIYQTGQRALKVFYVLKGAVKIAAQNDKKEVVKYVVQAGNLFGESCLMGDRYRRDCAYAMMNDTEILELEVNALLYLMRHNFSFAQSLLHLLGERLRQTEMHLENVVLKDSRSRILEFLHQMGVEHGRQVGVEILVKHNLTHQDIADLTGTSRQMVTAILNQLKRSNLVYFNRKKILFRDLDALSLYAN
ncbi:MAG: Crp/Fnr family transcriptional regulator [Saprospiraceae bacterium]|nr:Crp/Fnr family transcriptional regulator [Saprospiraceae bacterium]MDW8484124.1 Crp/Fnr family transcriptional regulator [Saprospiraceae bacterium]